jgi:hypothetical protein
VTGSEGNVNLLPHKIQFLRGIEARRVKPNQVLPRNAGHVYKPGVRKENPMAVVGYDNSLVEHLQNGLHLREPFGLLGLD